MASLNFTDVINETGSKLNSPEEMLGKGLLQPFNGANAGVILLSV